MTRFCLSAVAVCLALMIPGVANAQSEVVELPVIVGQEIPDDWEEQIDRQTEELPDEIREKIREKMKEAVRRRLEKTAADGSSSSEEEAKSAENGEEKSKTDENGVKKPEAEKKESSSASKDPMSDESKKLRAEMELNATRFKHQIAMYEKEVEAQRLQIEKSKIDRKLEEDRIAAQVATMERERDRLKLELDVLKQQAALDQARQAAKLAAAKAEKEELEVAMSVESTKESLEDRILGEENYPDEPFRDGVLTISLRRIELNGPMMQGVADYVCQRLDYFNNKSNKPIFLVIDSCPGGSAIEGMQIIQAMKESKAPVHVVVKRYAASMAAIITTLAEQSYCYPGAIILHHQASTSMYGNGRDIKDQVRQLKEISTRLIGPVAAKQGLTEEQFVDQMYEHRTSGDWELFGNEAAKRKWVDHVAHTIREEGIRTRPKGTRNPLVIRSIFGEQSEAEFSGYLERYEVALPEETDEKGKRFVRLPRLNPVDAWLIYNPDNYYR